MAHIYIALVDTPGFFASLIRHYLGQKYVHVVLSLDEQLSEAYSFGRRNPYIPLIAGFEREWSRQIAGAFPTAEYRICELDCTGEQKEAIRERLHKDYKNRFHMHYAAAGLLTLLCHRKFYLKNQYTCSSYLAEVLGEQGIFISEKHFSLVTPKDVCEYKNCRVVFEGRLSDLIVREEQAVVGMMILLFWQKLLKEHLGGYFFWYIVGLSLNVLLVILLLFVMLRPVLIRHLAEKIIVMAQKCGMKIPKEKWLEKLDGFLDGYRGTVLFFREHKEKILILIVMTFVQRSSAFLLTFLVYLGFGLSGTAMYQILLLQAAIYVAVDMLPVPGAQGITEAMYGKVFLPVFSGQYLVPAMCVTRGVGFYLMLVIGALWVLKIHYKKVGSGRKKACTNA